MCKPHDTGDLAKGLGQARAQGEQAKVKHQEAACEEGVKGVLN